jgi:hypothetical protein
LFTEAQQLVGWSLASNGNATNVGPGITSYPMALGSVTDDGFMSTLTGCGAAGCGGRRLRNWTCAVASISSAGGAITNNKYVEFSFSVNPGSPAVVVNSFQFTASSGFTTNCTGSPSFGLRWSIDNPTPGSWIRQTGACAAELLRQLNPANNGACVTYTTNATSSAGCAVQTFPITVNAGQRLRFRIYIGTDYSANWAVMFSNVSFNGSNPLPVELSAFNAHCVNDQTRLSWTTESEQHASHFLLERSRDGLSWEETAEINAAGTTSVSHDYAVYDDTDHDGMRYYRLRQVDLNGNERYYGPISVECTAGTTGFALYPNPAQDAFTVRIETEQKLGDGFLVVYNLNGQKICERAIDLLPGTNTAYFNEELAPGSYLIRTEGEGYAGRFLPVKLIVSN